MKHCDGKQISDTDLYRYRHLYSMNVATMLLKYLFPDTIGKEWLELLFVMLQNYIYNLKINTTFSHSYSIYLSQMCLLLQYLMGNPCCVENN